MKNSCHLLQGERLKAVVGINRQFYSHDVSFKFYNRACLGTSRHATIAFMINEMSPVMQQLWLAKALAVAHASDHMHLPAQQELLSQWTTQACNNPSTEWDHAHNLAKYWLQGLRSSSHSAKAKEFLGQMVACKFLQGPTLAAAVMFFEAETQPLRMMRLWHLTKDIFSQELLVLHLERLLLPPLPQGKKLKVSQVGRHFWKTWLDLETALTPEAFAKGMLLNVRSNLLSRQGVDAKTAATEAWAMLCDVEAHLPPMAPESELMATLGHLPRLVSILVEYSDMQMLRHLPWANVQAKFDAQPDLFASVWTHFFERHKNILLDILPDIQPQYHAAIFESYMAIPELQLDEERAGPLLRLVNAHPMWAPLLNKTLSSKSGHSRLGTYLLSSGSNKAELRAKNFPSAFLSNLTSVQWNRVLNLDFRTSHTQSGKLDYIWEMVQQHGLDALARSPELHKITLQAIQAVVHDNRQVSPWDVTLGLPPFCTHLINWYLPQTERLPWLLAWSEKPSQDKMLAQTYAWFNPEVTVPPLEELRALRQVLPDGTLMDVLRHLTAKVESLPLPDMV